MTKNNKNELKVIDVDATFDFEEHEAHNPLDDVEIGQWYWVSEEAEEEEEEEEDIKNYRDRGINYDLHVGDVKRYNGIDWGDHRRLDKIQTS